MGEGGTGSVLHLAVQLAAANERAAQWEQRCALAQEDARHQARLREEAEQRERECLRAQAATATASAAAASATPAPATVAAAAAEAAEAAGPGRGASNLLHLLAHCQVLPSPAWLAARVPHADAWLESATVQHELWEADPPDPAHIGKSLLSRLRHPVPPR